MHKRKDSGVAPSSPGNSTGGLFNHRGSGSSSEKGGPVPVLFDHCQIAQRGAQRGDQKRWYYLDACRSTGIDLVLATVSFCLLMGDMSVLVRRPHRR